jgi:hypothetical protein
MLPPPSDGVSYAPQSVYVFENNGEENIGEQRKTKQGTITHRRKIFVPSPFIP